MKFPTYKDSSQKGEEGITIVKRIVERDMKWIFRKNHQEHDFGIDAFIDLTTEKNQITGKSIALQIKTGSSYFSEKASSGWVYRDDIAHLNYYLNHDIPVLILLVDEQTEKVYWNICEASKTEKSGASWKITIPSFSEFTVNHKKEIEKYVSPVRDFASQLEHFWEMNRMLKEISLLIFNVDREYIEKRDYRDLEEGITRLQVNPDLIEKLKGKVDIWIDGYNDDMRELYEIKEVKDWVNHLVKNVIGLSYFLRTDKSASFLRIMQYVKVKYIIIQDSVRDINGRMGRRTEIDMSTSGPFIQELYHDLNIFCEKHSIPLKVNKERTFEIAEFLTGKAIPDELKS